MDNGLAGMLKVLEFVLSLLGLAFLASLMGDSFTPSSRPKPRPATSHKPAVAGVPPLNIEPLRARLEALYFEKKISLEVMQEVLTLLQPKQSTVTPAVGGTPGIQPMMMSPSPAREAVLDSLGVTSPMTPAPRVTASQHPLEKTGFFSQENIKTLLLSGAALFVLSAYLFVRSYWDFIPAFVKFLALAAMAAGVYVSGWSLWGKGKTPKTAETLLGVGLLMVPFVVYGANVLILDQIWSAAQTWALGSVAMFLSAFLTVRMAKTYGLGAIVTLSFMSAIHGIAWKAGLSIQPELFWLSAGALSVGLAAVLLNLDIPLRKGLVDSANVSAALVFVAYLSNGFFWHAQGQLVAAFGLVILGALFAMEARFLEAPWAYAAGVLFMLAGAVGLHHAQVPVHNFGLFFIPAGMLMMLRGWTFERQGRSELGAPYFHLSQLAIIGSIVSVSGTFFYATDFAAMTSVLMLGILAYALSGILTKDPTFSYLGGLVVFFMIAISVYHYDLTFAGAILWFATAASGFIVLSLLAGRWSEAQVGLPFSYLGIGSLSLILCLLAGKWAVPFLADGSIALAMPDAEIMAGLRVGGMGVVAYLLMAGIKRQVQYVYPALASATLFYLYLLQYLHWPIDLWHMAWIVMASMAFFYGSQAGGWKNLSRCFALWAQLVLFGIGLSAIIANSAMAMQSVFWCFLIFIPALVIGSEDMMATCLVAGYLSHFLLFRQSHGMSGWDHRMAHYALQLVAVNCGVVFVRTLLSAWKPERSVEPFRVLAAAFSVISLFLALSDTSIAWQVYLVYGILSILVSVVHYEGRYLGIGTTLLVASYELFLSYQGVELTEAYTVPAALHLFIWGYVVRDSRDVRNLLYAAGQFILFFPTFGKSLSETWELHGVFLGIASLVVMVFGMSQRNRCLTMGGFGVLLLNALIQSHGFLRSVPRWIYLGAGGSLLMAMGGVFEFHREWLLRVRQRMAETLDQWD